MGSYDETSDIDQADPLDSLTDHDPDEPAETGYSPPERPPLEMRDPPTDWDQRQTPGISESIAREIPDLTAADILVGDPERRAGRLVAPDEGAHPDEEKDEIARDAGPAGYAASAEEAAMHVREEPQG